MTKHSFVAVTGNLTRLLVLAALVGSAASGGLIPQVGVEVVLFFLLGLAIAAAIILEPTNAIYLIMLMSLVGLVGRVNTALPGLPSLFTFLSGVAGAAYLARQTLNRRPFYLTSVYVPLVGFAVTAVVSGVVAGHPFALGWARGYVLRVLLVILTINVLHDSRSIITLAKIIALGGTFAAITALIDVVIPGWITGSAHAWRAVGVNESAYTGWYVAIALPFTIYFSRRASSTVARRWLIAVATIAQVAAFAAVGVRSVTIGAVVVLLLLLANREYRSGFIVWALPGLLILVSVGFMTNIHRFEDVANFLRTGIYDPTGTLSSRLVAWNMAIQLWRSSPVIGVGPGMYQVLAKFVISVVTESRTVSVFHEGAPSHSIVFDFLAELGIIGIACWLAVLAQAARCLNQCVSLAADTRQEDLRDLAIAARVAFWGMLVISLAEPLQNELVLWIMLAFPFALRRIIRTQGATVLKEASTNRRATYLATSGTDAGFL